ncbi:MAG: cysteine desulfurase family protein [Sphingomicrobium sp.]
MIYLDYQATTPLAPQVTQAMAPWIERHFANPHSPSREGRRAAAAIEIARGQVERLLASPDGPGAKGRLAFTSGATEALNWALKGSLECSNRRKLITIATEHAAVLDSADWLEGEGVEVVRLPVACDGLVDLTMAASAIDNSTALVAAMLVNNEIGVIQPVAELARLARSCGALMLCDAVQGFGRMAIPDGPDLVAISAHKLHGPKGIGALWMRAGCEPAPLLHGGGQEQGLRSGTLSPALCVGFGAAAALASERMTDDAAHIEGLWTAARAALDPAWKLNGSAERRYHGNLNLSRSGLDAARLLSDCRDIAFSLGSACASGSGRPSHVLRALGLSDRDARATIRLGFGRYTNEQELVAACCRLNKSAQLQKVAA